MLIPSRQEIAKSLGKDPDEVIIGYASTIGDLFHSGHVAYLRESKSRCDYLIVGLVADPTIDRSWKNKPVQSLLERYFQIATCVYSDCVIPLSGEQDLKDSLFLLKPDIRFVGEEYRGTSFTGSDIEGIDIVYLSRQHSFSSTDLRRRVFLAETLDKDESDKGLCNEIESPDEDLKDVGRQDY